MTAPPIQFGSGLLMLNPNAGFLTANPQPVRPFTIQDVTVDDAGEIKTLKGQNQRPDAVARGDIKSTFKWGMGRKDYFMLNQLFYGDIMQSGGTAAVPSEAHTVPATSTYVITITPPAFGTSTFTADLGVTYADGTPMQPVLVAPTVAGTYEVNLSTGAYTFSSTDASKAVLISYSFTTNKGTTIQVNNQIQGVNPQFEAWIVDTTTAQTNANKVANCVHIYACVMGKCSWTNKRSDFAMVDLEGEFFTNPAGRAIDYYING